MEIDTVPSKSSLLALFSDSTSKKTLVDNESALVFRSKHPVAPPTLALFGTSSRQIDDVTRALQDFKPIASFFPSWVSYVKGHKLGYRESHGGIKVAIGWFLTVPNGFLLYTSSTDLVLP